MPILKNFKPFPYRYNLCNASVAARIFNYIMWLYLGVISIGFVKITYATLIDFQRWELSEFLVNYQGGFVRRGLLGELLFIYSSLTGLDPRYIIMPTCLISTMFITIILVRKFCQYQIWWWILPLSFCLGAFRIGFIRKDAILLSLIAVIFMLYKSTKLGPIVKLILMALICQVAIFINEASFFMFVPLLSLILLRDKSYKISFVAKIIFIVLQFFTLLLLLHFTGNAGISQLIQHSWHSVFPDIISLEPGRTVASMSWTPEYALRFNDSVLFTDFATLSGWKSLLFRIIVFIVTPYIFVRYMYVCYRGTQSIFPCCRNIFATLISFQLFSLSPLFLGLSCDYGRLFMYIIVTTLLAVFILPRQTVACIFSDKIVSSFGKVDAFIDRVIPNRKITICLLILFYGVPYCYFFISDIFINSVSGTLIHYLTGSFRILFDKLAIIWM